MGPTVEVVDDDLDDANGIVEDDDVSVWSVDGRSVEMFCGAESAV
jgi:hypothetical protein